MQAPTWTKRLNPGQIRLFFIAITATAILMTGAVLSTTLSGNSNQAATVNHARSEVARPTSNARFLGWNILPGDPGTYPVTGPRDYRFLERNSLPGDDVRAVPPAHERGTRY
ncbi:MAG: hypothetical protein R3A46_03885 [Thermomicrobiales bacterium]